MCRTGIDLLREGLDLAGSACSSPFSTRIRKVISAARTSSNPNHGPLRAPHRRPRYFDADRMDPFHAPGHRRNQSPPRHSGKRTIGTTTSLRNRSSSPWTPAGAHHRSRSSSAFRPTSRSSAKSPVKQNSARPIAQLETQMREAAENFEFERAASIAIASAP